MAEVTNDFIVMNNGEMVGTYTYDNVSLTILRLTATNTGGVGIFRYAFHRITDDSIAAQGQINVGDGQLVRDVSAFGIKMAMLGPQGNVLLPPFWWTAGWSLT